MKDYEIRKKRIWKGRFAPQGFMFIVIYLTIGLEKDKMKYTNAVAVRGGLTKEQEIEIGKKLRKAITDKYNV